MGSFFGFGFIVLIDIKETCNNTLTIPRHVKTALHSQLNRRNKRLTTVVEIFKTDQFTNVARRSRCSTLATRPSPTQPTITIDV